MIKSFKLAAVAFILAASTSFTWAAPQSPEAEKNGASRFEPQAQEAIKTTVTQAAVTKKAVTLIIVDPAELKSLINKKLDEKYGSIDYYGKWRFWDDRSFVVMQRIPDEKGFEEGRELWFFDSCGEVTDDCRIESPELKVKFPATLHLDGTDQKGGRRSPTEKELQSFRVGLERKVAGGKLVASLLGNYYVNDFGSYKKLEMDDLIDFKAYRAAEAALDYVGCDQAGCP